MLDMVGEDGHGTIEKGILNAEQDAHNAGDDFPTIIERNIPLHSVYND